MKTICKKFSEESYINIKVVTRGGNKMTRDLKSNPLIHDHNLLYLAKERRLWS